MADRDHVLAARIAQLDEKKRPVLSALAEINSGWASPARLTELNAELHRLQMLQFELRIHCTQWIASVQRPP